MDGLFNSFFVAVFVLPPDFSYLIVNAGNLTADYDLSLSFYNYSIISMRLRPDFGVSIRL